MYVFLDYSLATIHGGLVIFNLTGWAWPVTRRPHLVVISLTFLSWFGLGIFKGWGYCPFTDWHWQVKRQLGESDLPSSAIKYYVDRLSGTSWEPFMVDVMTLSLAVAALILSGWLNWRDLKRG